MITASAMARIILEATSPDTNVRLSHADGDTLARETLRLLDENRRLKQELERCKLLQQGGGPW